MKIIHGSNRRVAVSLMALSTLGAALAPAVAGASSPASTVNVVGYSVVGPAFTALESAFHATAAGQNVTFTNSFGASDTQTTNIANGQPADLVNLSYGANLNTLVTAGKVASTWSSQELSIGAVNHSTQTTFTTPGILTDSIVDIIVRPGNPLHIKGWADLVKAGVKIVTPNPLTSGSAKWNLLAAYGSQLTLHHTATQSQDFLKKIIQHVTSQPVSGSAAMAAFIAGTGNVLLDYEDNAHAAKAAGKAIQIVTPTQSFLIENPIALTKTGTSNPGAKAFYKYLFSAAGQGILASLGYRPVLKSTWAATHTSFPVILAANLYSIGRLSTKGWAVVDPTFFGPNVTFPAGDHTHPKTGIVTYLEQFAGQST